MPMSTPTQPKAATRVALKGRDTESRIAASAMTLGIAADFRIFWLFIWFFRL